MQFNVEQLFTPISLGKFLYSIKAPAHFFTDFVYKTKEVIVDKIYGYAKPKNYNKRAIAVADEAESMQVENDSVDGNMIALPEAREKVFISLETLRNLTYAYQGQNVLEDKIGQLKKRLKIYKEWLFSQVVTTGKIVINEINYSVDFGLKQNHKYTATGGEKWDANNANIIKQLETAVQRIRSDYGIAPTKLILGGDLLPLFLQNEQISSIFDNRRYMLGVIQPNDYYIGEIFISGVRLEIYGVSDLFTNTDSQEQPFVDPKTAILLNDSEYYYVERTIPDKFMEIYGGLSEVQNVENIYIDKFINYDPRGIWLRTFYSFVPILNPDTVYIIKAL